MAGKRRQPGSNGDYKALRSVETRREKISTKEQAVHVQRQRARGTVHLAIEHSCFISRDTQGKGEGVVMTQLKGLCVSLQLVFQR